MAEILITFVVLLTIVGAMSVGVLMGRKPISGSCGGLANAGVGGPCEICGGCGFTGIDECSSCYGYGFYSICGTRDNPFPSKDD